MPPQPRISGVLNKLRGLSAALVVGVAFHSSAAVLYVTQLGIPPNTNSLAGLNAWTNVNPGDVVHLVGTFTNGIDITGPFVGDYGNPVTFLFETGANFTAPAWGQKYNTANSYNNTQPFYFSDVKGVVIDGGANGVIQATANAAGWLQWSNRSEAITLNMDGGAFEVKNLTISNLFQRFNGQDEAYTPGHTGDGNYLVSGNAIAVNGGFSNSSIHNCNISGAANLVAISYNGDTANAQIYSNNLSHCSFGIQLYGSFQAQGTGWQLWANNINTGDDWSGNNTAYHGNGIICNQHQTTLLIRDPAVPARYTNGFFNVTLPEWGNYGSYYNWSPQGDATNYYIKNGSTYYTNVTSFFAETNVAVLYGATNALVTATLYRLYGATNFGMQIYRNYFGPKWGTNASGWVGVYADMPSGFQNYKIYNNVVVIDNITSPSLMGNSVSASDHCLIANNTLIQINTVPIGIGFTSGFGGGTLYNNLVYNFDKAVSFNTTATDSRGWGSFTGLSNNVYYGISEWMAGQGTWPTLFYNPGGALPIYGPGVAIYRQQDGYETLSKTNQPLLEATYAPLTNDVVLITNGVNLTYLGITNDFYGSPRPSSGAWTVGAFQDAGQPAVFAPAAFRFWGRFP